MKIKHDYTTRSSSLWQRCRILVSRIPSRLMILMKNKKHHTRGARREDGKAWNWIKTAQKAGRFRSISGPHLEGGSWILNTLAVRFLEPSKTQLFMWFLFNFYSIFHFPNISARRVSIWILKDDNAHYKTIIPSAEGCFRTTLSYLYFARLSGVKGSESFVLNSKNKYWSMMREVGQALKLNQIKI